MYFTERKIRYADLVVPFTKCPFKNVEDDCPFVEYWKLTSVEEQIQVIENLPEEELVSLRNHHRICQERIIKNAQFKYRLKSIGGILSECFILENL